MRQLETQERMLERDPLESGQPRPTVQVTWSAFVPGTFVGRSKRASAVAVGSGVAVGLAVTGVSTGVVGSTISTPSPPLAPPVTARGWLASTAAMSVAADWVSGSTLFGSAAS